MDMLCLVLTGELAAGSQARAALAGAFGIAEGELEARVLERAPLVARQGLERGEAEAQAAELRAAGVGIEAQPDDGSRAWLLRGRRIAGPLPVPALSRHARPGDHWCRDGERHWQVWREHAVPPALPGAAGRSWRRPARWFLVAAAALVLIAVWAGRERTPPLSRTAAAPPAKAAATAAPPVAAHTKPAWFCDPPGSAAPSSDEDRFLVAGGARRLTGRHVRKGDTYVAEAAQRIDEHCRVDRLQLYVFRNGVFVGTALAHPASPPHGRRIVDFDLADDQQLDYHLADCDDGGACDQVVARGARLVHAPAGWSLQRADADNPNTPRLIRQLPPAYPAEALRQRHQGMVLLRIAIDSEGQPGAVQVLRSSGYPELDQAATAAARQWRFRPARRQGKAVASTANVPVNFSLRSQ